LSPARPTLVIATIAAAALTSVAGSAIAALPANVIALKGTTSQKYDVRLSFGTKTRSINGFSVDYTCLGKALKFEQDLKTIADGGRDNKVLSRVKADGSVSLDRSAEVTRFSEDGPFPFGTGRLILKGKLTSTGRKRVLTGTIRVTSKKCPSAKQLSFRAAGNVPASVR
jgi:hypothetical protein